VYYNRGDRFITDPVRFTVPSWVLSEQDKSNLARRTDGNLPVGVFGQVPLVGDVETATGLGDHFSGGSAINPVGANVEHNGGGKRAFYVYGRREFTAGGI
jgi:hypothetical protein